MRKIVLKSLLPLILLYFIVSCTSASDESAATTVENSMKINEDTALFHLGFSNCTEGICWNGMTPGVTTFSDAKSTVEKLFESDSMRINRSSISWKTPNSNSILAGSMNFNYKGVLSEIHISLSIEKVAMAELDNWLGEPNLVYVARAFSSEVLCAGSFVAYSDFGVRAFLYPEGDMVGISRSQFIANIELVEPESMEGWTITDHWVLDWQGYTDYCAVVADQ